MKKEIKKTHQAHVMSILFSFESTRNDLTTDFLLSYIHYIKAIKL
jgi:hypothetical protein